MAPSERSSVEGKDVKPPRGIFRPWGWELLALASSVGPLVAIFVLLAKYDKQELPTWPYSININTLVAVLSTLVRVAQVMVLNEIIGQAKWTRFARRSGTVDEFQAFDSASRGIPGCLVLLPFVRLGLRGRRLAVVAALVTILSLPSDAFTQQAIKSVPCNRPSSDSKLQAGVPIAYKVPGAEREFLDFNRNYVMGRHVKSALITGLSVPNSNDTAAQADCSSGNCTFPEVMGVSHSTMGMCTKCVDISKHAKVIQGDGPPLPNITLSGQWISLLEGSPWLSVGEANTSTYESDLPPDFLNVSQQGFANISMLAFSECGNAEKKCPEQVTGQGDEPISYIGTVCTLYPCVKDFTAVVSDGKLEENITSTIPARVSGQWDENYNNYVNGQGPPPPPRMVVKSPCVIDGEIYNTGNFSLVPRHTDKRAFEDIVIDNENVTVPTDCYFQMRGTYAQAMRDHLNNVFLTGLCLVNPSYIGDLGGAGLLCRDSMSGDPRDMFWLSSLFSMRNATLDTISENFESVATAATNFFRKDGYGNMSSIPSHGPSKAHVVGQVQRTTVCLELSWPWLLYQSILWLITVVLIVSSLASSFRHPEHPIWKSSLLPFLLFYGDPYAARPSAQEIRGSHGLLALENVSKKATVRLDTDRGVESYGLLQRGDRETRQKGGEQQVTVNEWEAVPRD